MTEKKKLKKPLGYARLIPGKCIACGERCMSACRSDSITMNDKGEPVINLAKCIGCRICIRTCPAKALETFYTPEQLQILAEIAAQTGAPVKVEEPVEETGVDARLKEYKGVWVFVEHTEGEPDEVSWELLGVGAKLARTRGVELSSIVIGDSSSSASRRSSCRRISSGKRSTAGRRSEAACDGRTRGTIRTASRSRRP